MTGVSRLAGASSSGGGLLLSQSDGARPIRPNPFSSSVIDTMSASEDRWWYWGDRTGVTLVNGSDAVLGDASLSISPDGSSMTARSARRQDVTLNLNDNLLGLWIRIENPSNLYMARVYLVSTPPSIAFYRKDYLIGTEDGADLIGDDWQLLLVDPRDGVRRGSAGTPDMANVLEVRIDVQSHGMGPTGTLFLGGVLEIPRHRVAFPNGVASITFDDNFADIDSLARPIVAKYGFRATNYIIQNQVGQPNRISMEHLHRESDLLGWEIGHHATTSVIHAATFPSLTPTQLRDEFTTAQDWFVTNGFPPAQSVSYPEGRYTNQTLEVVGEFFSSGRTTWPASFGQPLAIPPAFGPARLRSRSLTEGVAVEDWPEDYLDPTVDVGGWFIIHGHRFGVTDGPGQVAVTKFDALLAAIADRGMPVLPVCEVIARLALPGTN